MPEISVIVPVYNGKDFILRCYEHIKKQTFQDYEIIFVDDGSKDNSLEILDEIAKKDERVKVIAQENKRQGGARNSGVKAAKGNWISYVDIDDWMSENFLEELHNAAIKHGADISMTNVVRYKQEDNKKYLLKYDKEQCYTEPTQKALITNGNGTGRGVWNKLFRREFLLTNNIVFREKVAYEDCDYSAKAVFLANKIVTVPDASYFYFVNPKSTMRMVSDDKKQHDKYIGMKITMLFELKNGIFKKVDRINKFDYSFFGLNLMRVKEKITLEKTYEEWWLFDFIKIFWKKVKTEV